MPSTTNHGRQPSSTITASVAARGTVTERGKSPARSRATPMESPAAAQTRMSVSSSGPCALTNSPSSAAMSKRAVTPKTAPSRKPLSSTTQSEPSPSATPPAHAVIATDMLLVAIAEEEYEGGSVVVSASVQRWPRLSSSTVSGPSSATATPGSNTATARPSSAVSRKSATATAMSGACARTARGKRTKKKLTSEKRRSSPCCSSVPPCTASRARRCAAPVPGKRLRARAWSCSSCR